jgi:hypothetical protein
MSVVSGIIVEPARGVWVADLDFNEEDEVTGVFEFGGVTWTGVVRDNRTEGGLQKVKIVGGKAPVHQRVASRSFKDESLPGMLASLLTNTGLEGSADDTKEVPVYCVLGGPLGLVLSKIASVLNIDWYVTRTGSVTLQTRTGVEVAPPRIASDVDAAVILQVSECSEISPGDIYDGKQVRSLCWRLTSQRLLVEVSFSDMPRVEPSLGYELTYSGRIVRQVVDEPLVDVLVGNELGIRGVPLVVGGPFRVEAAADNLCRLTFEGADPRRPYVSALIQSGTKRVAREGDTVDCGTLMFVDSGPAGPEVLTWTPPPTEAMPIPVPVVVGAAPVALFGVIDSGSDEVKIP